MGKGIVVLRKMFLKSEHEPIFAMKSNELFAQIMKAKTLIVGLVDVEGKDRLVCVGSFTESCLGLSDSRKRELIYTKYYRRS